MDKSFSTVSLIVDETDPRDPAAKCDRCGRRGTVARAVRHSEPPLVFRYCSSCWPEAQQEFEARQREELKQWEEAPSALAARDAYSGEAPKSSPTSVAWSTNSRTWHDTRRFLALIAQPPSDGRAPNTIRLAVIAEEIRAIAAEMDGPIPPDIQEFLDRHSPPAT